MRQQCQVKQREVAEEDKKKKYQGQMDIIMENTQKNKIYKG